MFDEKQSVESGQETEKNCHRPCPGKDSRLEYYERGVG